MTTKTIKTVLFASLLVAMILPFSAMNFADAAPNENANDTAKENADKQTDRKAMKEAGYKLFPGVGWVHANDHANVEPKYIEHPENPGEMLLDLDAMEPAIRKSHENHNHENDEDVYPTHRNGYNMAAVKYEPNSMTYFNGYWKVPAEPVSWSADKTIFHFNALQPYSNVIFQPVLQYGDSSVCEAGAKWVTFAIIYINPTQWMATPCVDADVGDIIRGAVYKSGSTLWTVYLKNYGTGDIAYTQINYAGKADTALVALETYDLPASCSYLAGDERFYSMYIAGDSVNWADGSQASQWCGMDVNIIDDRTVELNNNN